MSIPSEVLVERLRAREAVPLNSSTSLCNQKFQVSERPASNFLV